MRFDKIVDKKQNVNNICMGVHPVLLELNQNVIDEDVKTRLCHPARLVQD